MADNPQTSIFRKESLERLSSPEQLDQLMQVVTPRSWIPLATLGTLIGLVVLWAIFGRIPITMVGRGVIVRTTSGSSELVGLTYFQQSDSEQIRPGMSIVLVPDSVQSERVGGVLARIKSISGPAITTLDAARQSKTIDSSLQADSVEVMTELERDPSTLSGYRWTSTGGSKLNLVPGVTTTARITLEERAPIAFIFPFLEAR
jgi:hypothetical protein